jgi:RNA ligase (TIGR02306 family)
MKRKLASIQTILNLEPIYGADNIVLATIMGWNVIVRNGEFQVGDKCVFMEYDSILPDGPEWSEFLRKKNFRVKTCKIRGVLSQGLALPMSILGINPKRTLWDWIKRRDGWKVGDDVTDFLKVKKYYPQQSGKYGFRSGTKARDFPSFIPKTDAIRIQSALHLLDQIVGREIYVTVKCDGTSSTFYKLDNKFGVCSRNREVKAGDNVYWQMADVYKLDSIPEGFAVQGEICGPGICKNKLRLNHLELFVFDVFNIKSGKYLSYYDLIDFCIKHSLKTVPLEFGPQSVMNNSLNDWLERAKGKYIGTDVNREGIVVRTTDRKISFKVLNNDFLIKEED